MDARTVGLIERGVEQIASVIFAGAVGFAANIFLRSVTGEPLIRLLAGGAGLGGFVLSGIAMRAASNRRRSSFTPAAFALRAFEPFEPEELVLTERDHLALVPGELVLTDEDRLDSKPLTDRADLLELDDVLAQADPDSRVVRLFDPNSMPTPGQLQSRIDNHLHRTPGTSSDASQALSEALAELRRSLRQ